MLFTQNLFAFNRGTHQPLGILPKFPITFGGKTIYIDMMVFQGPLDFNLLLVHDYVYVICFLHGGIIMDIHQLSFIGLSLIPSQPYSLNGPYMQVASPLPQVNYVSTYSMLVSTNDLANDIMHHVLGALEYDLSIISLDMYLF